MISCIFVYGSSAVGKTAVTKKVVKVVGGKRRLALIQGDFFVHMIYGCTHTDKELDIKYLNIGFALDVFLSNGYSVVIDDIFKRQKDVNGLISIMDRYNVSSCVFKLVAEQDVLLSRNRSRDYWDWIPEEKIIRYPELLNGITFGEEVIIDTTDKTLEETVREVLERLKKSGFYNPGSPSILEKTFHPVEDKAE
ncbi:MAG: hypothetical protein WCV59_02930 [Parcubacteria group bacterium]|jgi:hypothetical protein